jgi:hypothetical protein
MENIYINDFVNDLLDMSNEASKAKWECAKAITIELMKSAKEDIMSFEDIIIEEQKSCDISKIKQLAEKYSITILDDNYYFLCHIKSFDQRNKDITQEKEEIEKEFYTLCKNRHKTLTIIKYLITGKAVISIKGHDKIALNNSNFNNDLSQYLINKLFQANKTFYCNHCGWNENNKKEVKLEDLQTMTKVEENFISIYEEFTNTQERNIAIMFSILAKLLYKIEVFDEYIIKKDCEVTPQININYDNTWATTNKSCFMVDLFVHYKVIPDYMIEKTPQEKYQYIKSKLKQADKTINKFNNIDNQ